MRCNSSGTACQSEASENAGRLTSPAASADPEPALVDPPPVVIVAVPMARAIELSRSVKGLAGRSAEAVGAGAMDAPVLKGAT